MLAYNLCVYVCVTVFSDQTALIGCNLRLLDWVFKKLVTSKMCRCIEQTHNNIFCHTKPTLLIIMGMRDVLSFGTIYGWGDVPAVGFARLWTLRITFD